MLGTGGAAVWLWLGCALLCGIAASEKERNVVGWVVLSLFFGPLALIALAGLPVGKDDAWRPAALTPTLNPPSGTPSAQGS